MARREWARISEEDTRREYHGEKRCNCCGAHWTDLKMNGSAKCLSCGHSWAVSGSGGIVEIVDVYR